MEQHLPKYSFSLKAKEAAPAGQIYLGALLASALFISFFFGSLLFFLIILIISIIIFLGKEESAADHHGNLYVDVYHDSIMFSGKNYDFKNIKSFAFYDEIFGEEDIHLWLEFKTPGQRSIFIPIPNSVHKKEIYDIISQSILENTKREMSLTEQILLKFF